MCTMKNNQTIIQDIIKDQMLNSITKASLIYYIRSNSALKMSQEVLSSKKNSANLIVIEYNQFMFEISS